MERRNFLRTAALGLGGAALATPALAQCRTEVRWRMATGVAGNLDALRGAAEFLGRRVEALTGGAFRIDVRPADEIAPGTAVLDAVASGTVPIGFAAGRHDTGRDPALVFDAALPFGLNSRQRSVWMQHGGGRELMQRVFADHGVVPLPAGNTGPQMGGWFRKEIGSVQDLNGLKVRVAGVAGDILTKLGAVPQRIADADLRSALERGAVDAAEWGSPQDDLRLGLHKAARYYYYPGIWGSSTQASCYVGRRAWEQLPQEWQAVLEAASAETGLWLAARCDADNAAALTRLVAEGALLRPYPLDILKAAYRATREHLEALAARDPRFGTVYASWTRFRDSQRMWFGVAEQSYDRFLSLVASEDKRP
jgi:TRAP-type mannitol/chloroaromatic compound transport system substrate-binding protein